MMFSELKDQHRESREHLHPSLSLRTHRALSWLEKAEASEDEDSRFIFLWIGFNAAYATDIDAQYRINERETFQNFFQKLVDLDKQNKLYELLWSEFSSGVRALLDNKYVFQPFWDYQNGKVSEEDWKASFSAAKTVANKSLANRDTPKALSVIFDRIYTLRNQVFHGGATFGSSVNRSQVKDCASFLHQVLVITIGIMLGASNTLWGDPYYPVVSD